MMHIAFLTSEYPHAKVAHAAGIGTSIKNLATALVAEGVKVTVLVYGQMDNELIDDQGVSIHLIKNKKYPFLGWYLHRKHIEDYCNLVIQKENIDLLEAADWTGITAFMKFKIPVVIRFHGSDSYFCYLEQRKQKWKNFLFEKVAISNATAFIAPTNFAAELSKKIFNIKNKTIQTIHYGLNLTQFDNKTPGIFEKGLIVYVGTIIRKKGVLELPGIFSKVRQDFPEAKLLLIGSDSADVKTNAVSTWQLLQQQFNASDLKNVEYLGKIPYTEVQHYIRKANVCIFPTFAETLGMVTIEAMAMQKAVVNSDIGWSQELITDNESGFLVHPENHDLFANRIVSLLKHNSLCEQIGKQARARVEIQFDIKKIVKNNIVFYQKILNTNKKR